MALNVNELRKLYTALRDLSSLSGVDQYLMDELFICEDNYHAQVSHGYESLWEMAQNPIAIRGQDNHEAWTRDLVLMARKLERCARRGEAYWRDLDDKLDDYRIIVWLAYQYEKLATQSASIENPNSLDEPAESEQSPPYIVKLTNEQAREWLKMLGNDGPTEPLSRSDIEKLGIPYKKVDQVMLGKGIVKQFMPDATGDPKTKWRITRGEYETLKGIGNDWGKCKKNFGQTPAIPQPNSGEPTKIEPN